MEWGNAQSIKSMLRKIVYREGIGNVLADGILPAAKRIGRNSIDYAYQVKGLVTHHIYDEFSSGVALSVAVGRGDPMKSSTSAYDGILELLPLIFDAKMTTKYAEVLKEKAREITHTEHALSREGYEGKSELVAFCEDEITICDCLSVCKALGIGWFGIRPFNDEYRAILLSSGLGTDIDVGDLFVFARRVKNLERAYNIREGMTRELESLPKRCLDYPGDSGYYRRSVMESNKLEELKDKYYHLRGWDINTGIPTRETLQKQGLGYIADDLDKN
jgi:aldehyde:ferredoxin oxidoreductase